MLSAMQQIQPAFRLEAVIDYNMEHSDCGISQAEFLQIVSTQGSTVAWLIGKDNNFPLVAGAKTTDALSLPPIGNVAYQVAKAISLGTPECTRIYGRRTKTPVRRGNHCHQLYPEVRERGQREREAGMADLPGQTVLRLQGPV